MKKTSNSEMEKIAEEKGGKVEWIPAEISRHITDGNVWYYPQLNKKKRMSFRCKKCKTWYLLDECSNCRGVKFKCGLDKDRNLGVFCEKCDMGISLWTCTECGAKNLASKTFYLLDKGCFIASAVYTSKSTVEVDLFRKYRDVVLCNSLLVP